MRTKVESFTGFIEFLADHFNGTLGHILIKASPLLAPLPSAIAVFHAVFSRILESYGNGTGVVIVAVIMAGILTAVVEGIGFAAVNARDEIDTHNRKAEDVDRLDASKAQQTVRAYFAITLGTIFMFESAPAISEWFQGEIGFTAMLVHIAPLIFPFFSNIGASIYSLMDVLEKVRKSQKEGGEINGQIDKLSREIQSLLDAQKVAQIEQDELRKKLSNAQSENEKLQSEKAEMRSEITEYRVQNAALEATAKVAQSPAQKVAQLSNDEQVKLSKSERRSKLLEIAEVEPMISVSKLAQMLNAARNTVSNDLKDLESSGVIHRNGNGIEFLS